MSQPGQTPLPSIFNQSLARFKTSLTPAEVDDFQFTSLEDVEKAIADLQRKQAATKTLRNLNRLKPFLDAIEQYGKVIEIFVNASIMVAFIWVSTRTHKLYGDNIIADRHFCLKGSNKIRLAGYLPIESPNTAAIIN